MPEALELLKTRRSIPVVALVEPGPDDAALAEMLTVAARVPDHGKLVPWRFILYRGAAGRAAAEAVAELHRRAEPGVPEEVLAKDRQRIAGAPLVVGVVSSAAPHPEIPEWEQVLSVGAAAMNLVVAAHALGFAANWVTGWSAYDAEAGRLLGLRQGERFAGFVQIGTPKSPPVERDRPKLADIVSEWRPG